jgi:hypothetical protein
VCSGNNWLHRGEIADFRYVFAILHQKLPKLSEFQDCQFVHKNEVGYCGKGNNSIGILGIDIGAGIEQN